MLGDIKKNKKQQQQLGRLHGHNDQHGPSTKQAEGTWWPQLRGQWENSRSVSVLLSFF